MTLTADQLRTIVPGIRQAALDTFTPWLIRYMPDPRYVINTPQRIAGFIAQVAEESINFSAVRELDSGNRYEMSTRLGNTEPGDGPRFKGRGLIQITGRSNYTACSNALFGDIRLLANPNILATPQYAVQSACWYWKDRGLNAICDESETWVHPGEHGYSKFQWLTIEINGGLNGYTTRLANYERAKQVFNF